ncbi:TPA: DNA-binding protein, partial [Klebsiella oxytoca]|nr:DNA-binding protein [Klebsiella oxytoca]
MAGRIDYQIEKYSFTAVDESPRLTRQWSGVLAERRELQAG